MLNGADTAGPLLEISVAQSEATEFVVGVTVAEFIPRRVMHLTQLLDGVPLLS